MRFFFIKNICLLLTLLASFAVSEAQIVIRLKSGVEFPVGNFGKTQAENRQHGFAAPGPDFALQTGYNFNGGFSLNAAYGWSSSTFRQRQFINSHINPIEDGEFSPKNYRTNTLLLGPGYTFGISERAKLDLSLMIGSVKTAHPGYYFVTTSPLNPDVFWATSQRRLCFSFGTSYNYKFSDHLELGVYAGYKSSFVITSDLVQRVDYYPSPFSGIKASEIRDIAYKVINAGLSFAYRF